MYRLPPSLVGFVVLVITLLEAVNVVATLFYGKGDISFHAVFLAVMTAVGLAVRPAAAGAPADAPQLPPAPRDVRTAAPADDDGDQDDDEDDDPPPPRPRGARHRGGGR